MPYVPELMRSNHIRYYVLDNFARDVNKKMRPIVLITFDQFRFSARRLVTPQIPFFRNLNIDDYRP